MIKKITMNSFLFIKEAGKKTYDLTKNFYIKFRSDTAYRRKLYFTTLILYSSGFLFNSKYLRKKKGIDKLE